MLFRNTVTDVNTIVDDVKKISKEIDVDYEFATKTSLHGVGIIAREKSYLVKTVWTIIFFSLLVSLIWQITLLFIGFFEYSPVTKVYIQVDYK